jgi:hypothetical protein
MTAELNPAGAVDAQRPRRRRTALFWLALMTGILVLFVGYRLATLPELRPPFDVASFASVSIPDDRNAFTYYRQAKDRFVETSAVVPDAKGQSALWKKLEATIKNGWSKADEPVQKWLQLNQPALEVWKRGTECPDGMEMPPGAEIMETLLPLSQSLRELAKMALLQASDTAAKKTPAAAEAWPWYRAVLRSSRHVSRHSETIGRSIGVAIHGITVEPVLRWSSRPELTATDLRQVLADVLAIDAMTGPPSDTLKAEYLVSCKTMEANTAGLSGLPFRLIGLRESFQEALNLVYANWLSQVDRPRFRRLPSKGGKWHLFEIDPAAPRDPKLLSPAEIEERCGVARQSLATKLVGLLVPSIMAFIDSTDRERARQAALVLGVALELYHREHGRFPDALDDLVKEKYLKSIPADPFGKGEPFHYRRDSDPHQGAILWSVWTDGIDQDGKLEADLQQESATGDKIFRIAAPR